MIRLGRVDGNSMICLQPTNEKLRARAARLLPSVSKFRKRSKNRLEWQIGTSGRPFNPEQGGNATTSRLTRSIGGL
jgi:N-acetylmuramic acid 6-phosphate (MurNAc-6-P) etherase